MLEHEASKPEFWNDQKKAQATMQQLNEVKDLHEQLEGWIRGVEDAEVLLELGAEEGDESVTSEVSETLTRVTKELDAYELTQLLNGPYDNTPAIL
ncbi:MAG: PCRF domain-containing protein, partial [Candidatus Sericytochromatia bacterium]